MRKRAQALDTRNHGFQMLFRDAARLTINALKREGGDTDILLSHALSEIDKSGRWHVKNIGGNDVSIVIGNKAYLVDEDEYEEIVK